jgi:hypothetical protein
MPDTRHDAVSARPAIVRTRLESNVTVIAVAGELDLMRAGERRPPPFVRSRHEQVTRLLSLTETTELLLLAVGRSETTRRLR